jgi:hypothetical protein
MSGPRVTSGEDSKQDYSTPTDFMAAVEQRFGQVQFDLAAHQGNKRHERYFAPKEFELLFDAKKWTIDAMVGALVARGADHDEAQLAVSRAASFAEKAKVVVTNHDAAAYAKDAFAHSWHELSLTFPAADGGPGLLWLNCEFSDIGPWAKRSLFEAGAGANTTLLTPSTTGSNWTCDFVLGQADVYFLKGRLMFDGKNVFPKDCMLSHFWPGMTGATYIWDWKRNRIVRTWSLAA